MKTYQRIAVLLDCLERARNEEWRDRYEASLKSIMATAPSGSGVDCGTKLMEQSTPEKLIFGFEFHHMNEQGYYTCWTEHQAIITPSMIFGFSLKITGRNKNDIKDYLGELFNFWLDSEAAQD